MAFPSSPIEKQIDPPDGVQGNCSPPTTSGDTIRLGNNSNRRAPDFGWVFQRNGPYEYNGKLWAVFVDTLANTVEVWATTDGPTWAEVDSASHPTCLANTGSDESVTGTRTQYGAESVSVAPRLVAPDPIGDWYPALYVSYITASQAWGLAVFNLQTELWETDDFIGSTIDPFDPSGLATEAMRPNHALEYRAVNDDLVLFWNAFDGSSTETVYRSIITTSFGTAGIFAGGSGSARVLYGSTVVATSGRCFVCYTDATDDNIYVRSMASDDSPGTETKIGEDDGAAFSSRAYGGQLTVRSDDTVVATWWADRQQTAISNTEFTVSSSFAPDQASPTWTPKTVVDWKEKRESYPVAVETTDGELYAVFSSSVSGGTGNRIGYSLYDDNTETWGAVGTLVDLSLPIAGAEACENETIFDSHSVLPVGSSFGVLFNRGTASFDPDDVQDPRGARYDYSLPPWFWGDALTLTVTMNYYGPLGAVEPSIGGGGGGTFSL